MRVTLKQLRQRGVRRSERELASDEGIACVMTLAQVGGSLVLKVHADGDDSQMAPLVPVLFDAVCVSVHGGRMIWRGHQRHGAADDKSAPTYLQEWSVFVR